MTSDIFDLCLCLLSVSLCFLCVCLARCTGVQEIFQIKINFLALFACTDQKWPAGGALVTLKPTSAAGPHMEYELVCSLQRFCLPLLDLYTLKDLISVWRRSGTDELIFSSSLSSPSGRSCRRRRPPSLFSLLTAGPSEGWEHIWFITVHWHLDAWMRHKAQQRFRW